MRVIPGPLSPLKAHPHPVLLAPLLTLGIHLSLSSVSRASVLTSSTSGLPRSPRLHTIFSQVSTQQMGLSLHLPGYLCAQNEISVPAWVCKPPVLCPASICLTAFTTYSFRGGSTQSKGRPSRNSAEGTEHRKWGTKYGNPQKRR